MWQCLPNLFSIGDQHQQGIHHFLNANPTKPLGNAGTKGGHQGLHGLARLDALDINKCDSVCPFSVVRPPALATLSPLGNGFPKTNSHQNSESKPLPTVFDQLPLGLPPIRIGRPSLGQFCSRFKGFQTS